MSTETTRKLLVCLDLTDIDLEDAARRVLRFPAVADKSFLIHIGDRTVGGLCVRDQLVGPWQVPVSDVAITASGFESITGEAMAMGERTPLATIKLTSSELIEELDDRPDLREDAALIREQADRCRDILRSMGRAGKDDLHMRQAPLFEVIREAAEPHQDRGKDVFIEHEAGPGGAEAQPLILRRPEIIHGLRNLIQNAVDFARSTVWVEAIWTDETVTVRIIDDGRGFPPHIIGRIGDPFVRNRRHGSDRRARPGYEGMGLGLFIAKTLLERSGAELSFANASDPFRPLPDDNARRGAVIEVVWPRSRIVPAPTQPGTPFGKNQPFEA